LFHDVEKPVFAEKMGPRGFESIQTLGALVRAGAMYKGASMSFEKPSRKEISLSCDEAGPEDGTDPKTFLRKSTRKVVNRKALQLCSEVARTLNSVLAGECGDDLLRELAVESVVPAPNSSRLVVTLYLLETANTVDPDQVLAHLERAYGLLRSEVAAAINRKHVPELTFRIARPEQGRA
jgi:ribosome-binding factor A